MAKLDALLPSPTPGYPPRPADGSVRQTLTVRQHRGDCKACLEYDYCFCNPHGAVQLHPSLAKAPVGSHDGNHGSALVLLSSALVGVQR